MAVLAILGSTPLHGDSVEHLGSLTLSRVVSSCVVQGAWRNLRNQPFQALHYNEETEARTSWVSHGVMCQCVWELGRQGRPPAYWPSTPSTTSVRPLHTTQNTILWVASVSQDWQRRPDWLFESWPTQGTWLSKSKPQRGIPSLQGLLFLEIAVVSSL